MCQIRLSLFLNDPHGFLAIWQPGNRQPATSNRWSRDLYFIVIILVWTVFSDRSWTSKLTSCKFRSPWIGGTKRVNLAFKGNEGNKQFSNPLSDPIRFVVSLTMDTINRYFQCPWFDQYCLVVFSATVWFLPRTCGRVFFGLNCGVAPKAKSTLRRGYYLSSRKKASYFWRGRYLDHGFIPMFSSL